MMSALKGLIAVAAASTLVASPAFAAANAAQSLSVAQARVGAPAAHGSKIGSGSTATLINIGILGALAAIVLVATTTGGDNSDSN